MIAQGRLSFRGFGTKLNVRNKLITQVDAWITASSIDIAAGNRLKQIINDLSPGVQDAEGVYLNISIVNDLASEFVILLQPVELS